MRGYFGVALTVSVGIGSAPSFASVPRATHASATPCDRALASAVSRQRSSAIPPSCWQVGPVTLGMTEEEAEQRLGAPVARSSGVTSAATLYVFPVAGGALVVDGRARFRMAELRFLDKRLIAIDTEPPFTMTSAPCSQGHVPSRPDEVDGTARAGPLLRILGTGVGDSLSQVRKRFGRSPAPNRSRDWYSYLPIPLSLDVDRNRITGFEVARDEASLLAKRPWPKLYLNHVAATCRLTGIDFALGT